MLRGASEIHIALVNAKGSQEGQENGSTTSRQHLLLELPTGQG